jgi:pyruvate/2-oxoglutarate dehydrogenase complex dihydrolipoamide acyltransferase (E2) component
VNNTALIPVVYIGHKERKADNVAGSGVVWHGHGDVQPVTPQQWGLLSKYPQIWTREAFEDATTPVASAASMALGEATPGGSLGTATEQSPVLGTSADDGSAGIYGTDQLPGLVEVGGQMVQLGTVVAGAHAASGLSVDDWNGLVPQIRDQLVIEHLELMRAQAAPAKAPAQEPEQKPSTPAAAPAADAKPKAAAAPRQRRQAAAPTGEVS